MKIKVAILFGGKSAEHEISIESAKFVYESLDKNRFAPVLIGIDKEGSWYLCKDDFCLEGGVTPFVGCFSYLQGVDVVFPVLHGPFGEDGSVQGFLEVLDLPYVGANVLGSSVSMDKDVMKRLLKESGLPIGKFFAYQERPIFEDVEKALGLPFFVKPANMGSSIGISKVNEFSEFEEAITLAFQYDTKIIIEEAIVCREIECSVLGLDTPIASLPGEVLAKGGVYSFDAKYNDEAGTVFHLPVKLPKKQEEEVKRLSLQAFSALCVEGMARVDFFLKESGEFLINELNTIPGFTKMSVYPKLWEASGISGKDLVTHLIEIAMARHQKRKTLSVERVLNLV